MNWFPLAFPDLVEYVNDFLANYDSNEEYKAFIQQGTATSESVKNRLEYWNNAVDNM